MRKNTEHDQRKPEDKLHELEYLFKTYFLPLFVCGGGALLGIEYLKLFSKNPEYLAHLTTTSQLCALLIVGLILQGRGIPPRR